jgi:steroid delta-isomerase
MNTTHIEALVAYFESLTPAAIDNMGAYYDIAAYFRDPFNEVHSLSAIQAIFRKMYQQVDAPRFTVLDRYVADNGVTLTWDFSFQLHLPGKPERHIHGLTLLHFNDVGKVIFHRDYWDAAQELYEQLPVIGGCSAGCGAGWGISQY